MRSRGPSATEVFTAETIADAFGVTKSSYTSVPLSPVHVHEASRPLRRLSAHVFLAVTSGLH